MAVLALCCVGVGLFMARGARDTSVQVVLDANGFRDRRRGDLLVPWAKVRGVRSVSGRMGRVVMLAFEKHAHGNRFARHAGQDIVDAVRKFAPHVTVGANLPP